MVVSCANNPHCARLAIVQKPVAIGISVCGMGILRTTHGKDEADTILYPLHSWLSISSFQTLLSLLSFKLVTKESPFQFRLPLERELLHVTIEE